MKNTRLFFCLYTTLLIGGTLARADDALVVDAAPGEGPKMKLTVPPGWVAEVTPGEKPSDGPTVRLTTPAQGKPVGMLELTFIWDDKGEMKDHDAISKEMDLTTVMYAEGRKVPKVTLESKSVWGLYSVFMAADSVLPQQPGAAKCTVAGLLRTGNGYMINFVLLNDDPKGAPCQQALKFLQEGIAAAAAK